MSGSQTSTTNTIEKADPWEPAQPYLKEILGQASDIYGRGSMFVPANPFQTQGLGQMASTALSGNPLTQSGIDLTKGVLGSGGMNDQQRAATDALMPYARGDYLSGGNPHLDAIIGRNADTISDTVRSEMAGLGRTGSGAHQGILADSIGEMASNLRYGDYANQQANQMRAAGQVFGQNQQAGDQAFRYLALAPQVDDMRYADASKLTDVGAALRGFGQQQALAPWSDLQNYAGLITGTSAPYGVREGSSTSTQSGGSSALSGILGGLSILGGLFSDERVKKDIKKVGKTDAGSNVYTYKYKGDPTGTTHMGVMAQEMLEDQPETVIDAGGILGVNYAGIR